MVSDIFLGISGGCFVWGAQVLDYARHRAFLGTLWRRLSLVGGGDLDNVRRHDAAARYHHPSTPSLPNTIRCGGISICTWTSGIPFFSLLLACFSWLLVVDVAIHSGEKV